MVICSFERINRLITHPYIVTSYKTGEDENTWFQWTSLRPERLPNVTVKTLRWSVPWIPWNALFSTLRRNKSTRKLSRTWLLLSSWNPRWLFPPRPGIEYQRDPYQRDPYQRSQYPTYVSPSPRYESNRRIRDEEISYGTANSATVRGELRSCLNKIGVQVNRRFGEYLKPLHTYVMLPEHKILRPNIMEVTSFVSRVTPALNGSNPLMSQLVSTVIECIEIYRVVQTQPHAPARKRNYSQEGPQNKKQTSPNPGNYSPRDNSVGTPDTSRNDSTSRSTTSNTSKSRSRDAWNAPSTKRSLDSKDSEKTAITPTTRNGGCHVSTSSSRKSARNVPMANHTNMASVQTRPEVDKNHPRSNETPVSVTFNVPKKQAFSNEQEAKSNRRKRR